MGGVFLLGYACLEGTTERSDGNRARSVRRDGARTMCLEGTTPQDRLLLESRTERNDSNQVRSAWEIQLIRYGLEKSRLVAMYKELSFGVVPSSLIRTLRARLLSLRSVVPLL